MVIGDRTLSEFVRQVPPVRLEVLRWVPEGGDGAGERTQAGNAECTQHAGTYSLSTRATNVRRVGV